MINDTLDPAVVRAVNLLDLPTSWAAAEPRDWAVQRSGAAGALSFAAVEPGMRVLEIGTGYDGFTAAILAELVGAGGSVISLAPNQARADRAIAAHGAGHYGRLSFQAGSPLDGWPVGAPYDLVIASCEVRRLPLSWLHQCRPPGSRWRSTFTTRSTIIVPTRVAEQHTARLLRVDVDEERQPIAPQLYAAGPDERPILHGDPTGYALHIRRAVNTTPDAQRTDR